MGRSDLALPCGIQIEEAGEVESKDAMRWRLKWYVALSVVSMLGVASRDDACHFVGCVGGCEVLPWLVGTGAALRLV